MPDSTVSNMEMFNAFMAALKDELSEKDEPESKLVQDARQTDVISIYTAPELIRLLEMT